MTGRKKFKDKDILKEDHYFDILYLIMWAKKHNKKIRFKHLSFALVKNHGKEKGKKISDRKLKEMLKFFQEKADKEDSKVIEWILKGKKVSTNNNLNTNYLKKLREYNFIKSKPFYIPLPKCMILLNEYIIHERIDQFFNEYLPKLYNGHNYTAGAAKASFDLENIVYISTLELLKKYEKRKK